MKCRRALVLSVKPLAGNAISSAKANGGASFHLRSVYLGPLRTQWAGGRLHNASTSGRDA
jgi:hypothetical protein